MFAHGLFAWRLAIHASRTTKDYREKPDNTRFAPMIHVK
jgi:hypothetical protein